MDKDMDSKQREEEGRRPSTAGGTSQSTHNTLEGGRELISDGDIVFDPQDATLDRVARNAPEGPESRRHLASSREGRDDHRQEGWGFRIRNFLLR